MTEIEIKYNALKVAYPQIGNPKINESICQDGTGHYRRFDGGDIFWSGQPGTPAFLLGGLIRDKWAALGWEHSKLGYPTSDETDAASGKSSRLINFQNGIVIWNNGSPEAFAIYGPIYLKWKEQGVDTGPLGLPLTDELGISGGSRRYNYFEGGAIFWTSATGATIVKGAKITDKKVAVVLSGGGAKGDFQLGALAALYEKGIRPSIICGTSVGALNAFLLAHGETGLDKLKKTWFGLFHNDHMWNLDDWWIEVDKDLREPVVASFRGEKSSLDPFLGTTAGSGFLGAFGGSIIFGPFGALLAFIGVSALTAFDKIKKFANLITGKARALLNMKPIERLFTVHTQQNLINEWVAAGNQLRLATVALGSGELCYVTETGDLIDREQKKVLASGISLIAGALASSAIGSVFPPVKFAGDSWVDGGHRENVPLKSALEMGATEVYVISSGPVGKNSSVNYTEEGFMGPKDSYKNLDGETIRPFDFENKYLVDIAVRAILDITGDENAAADIYSWIETKQATIYLIKPTFPTHDIITIDPNLIRVNYDYGYRVASDVLAGINNDMLNVSDQMALKQGRLHHLRNRTIKNMNIPWSAEIGTLIRDIELLTTQRKNAGVKIKGPEVQNPYPIGDSMQCGDMLLTGQSIISANGQYQLINQPDNLLVLSDIKSGTPIWMWTNPDKITSGSCVFQPDGNFVIYDPSFKNALWSSNEFFAPENRMKHDNVLKVESDGVIRIYEHQDIGNPKILWQSKVTTPVTGSIFIDNQTSMEVTVSFHNVGDDPKSIFTTIGMPNGIAAAGNITPFNLPLGYTQIQVSINGGHHRALSSGETYLVNWDDRVHIFNDTDLAVTIRFFHPGDLFLDIPIVTAAESTHKLPPHTDWFWKMPNDLASVVYTWNNRKAE
ncbi:MAG: patatin-like phospholipase family protein, partial [Chitinophagaceae bacterium]